MGEATDTINEEMAPRVGEMEEVLEYIVSFQLLQIMKEQRPLTKAVNLKTI